MHDLHRKHILKKRARRERAHLRGRNRIAGSPERPRLAVYKSLRYIYAQIVDDLAGSTLVAASSLEKDVRDALGKSKDNKDAAKAVGAKVAERALEKGIKSVVFDRSGYVYHGKVKALAEGAREKGLQF
jgi:large subunit ribosomal protein L18